MLRGFFIEMTILRLEPSCMNEATQGRSCPRKTSELGDGRGPVSVYPRWNGIVNLRKSKGKKQAKRGACSREPERALEHPQHREKKGRTKMQGHRKTDGYVTQCDYLG